MNHDLPERRSALYPAPASTTTRMKRVTRIYASTLADVLSVAMKNRA